VALEDNSCCWFFFLLLLERLDSLPVESDVNNIFCKCTSNYIERSIDAIIILPVDDAFDKDGSCSSFTESEAPSPEFYQVKQNYTLVRD